jgi:ligand-binding SRPBCC domain-containing protein
MKVRWLNLLVLVLVLLVSLIPAGTVFADDDGNYKFYGTIESLPATGLIGDWVVSGRTVHVTAATRIEQEHGPAVVGTYVEVKGWQQADGSVNATKIEVKQSPGGGGGGYVKFYGTIESLPNTPGWIGDWVVSGRTVHVTAATLIKQKKGPVAVGAYIEVEGTQQADGSVNATKIEVKQGTGGGGSYVKFYGTIESLPNTPGWIGDWVVSGRTVHVTAATLIKQKKGPVRVGAYVEVKGLQQADGSVNASKIEVKR